MSRAHVREVDGDEPEDRPELPLSPYPNYVTARGLAQLQARREACEAAITALPPDAADRRQRRAALDRELRWLQARIASAQLVGGERHSDRIAFGAEVTVVDEDDREFRYRIVGEDEAEPDAGRISWTSPLARALIGLKVGEVATWPRPAGDCEVEVRAIAFPTD
ncbi:MAG: transcription elongation factor GreAB [Xanthomonadaceae bacterium]|nr:transcription elongation factor GreAB [Xanthomonadaceae bacterium]